MDFKDWSPRRSLELKLQRSLTSIGTSIGKSIKDMTDPFEIMNTILSWTDNLLLHGFAEVAAKNLVASLFESTARTWRAAAQENSDGRVIYEALRKELRGPVGAAVDFQIKRNAEIIKSIPLDIARQVTKYVSEESLKGRRADVIADDIIAKFPNLVKKKVALIARTETSKTSTALTQARCENIGLSWYTWRTSEDIRVRDSHRHMEGVLIKWTNPPSPEKIIGMNNPPAPYHAGNIYNCRCYPEPIVNLNNVQFPAKVYWAGSIVTLTRKVFERRT